MAADIAGQATRNGGKILLVGMGTPIQTLPISAAALREVDLVGVWRYANCYPDGIAMMQQAGKDGIPDIRKLITHRFHGLDQCLEAFDMAAKTSDKNGEDIRDDDSSRTEQLQENRDIESGAVRLAIGDATCLLAAEERAFILHLTTRHLLQFVRQLRGALTAMRLYDTDHDIFATATATNALT